MSPGLLETSWHRCWSLLNAHGNGLSLMQKLVGTYEEPQRNITHFSICANACHYSQPILIFMEYEAQVWAEYSWAPATIFREKRAIILRGFLTRTPIYNTPRLHEMFELQARSNLLYSLEMLGIAG
jgi:hypothetical protein